ncbi:outer membrane protein assembly factor BamE domain-containing protein [Parasulfitobacter algicola]|uniref:Outer membrane protein assembly factor BamE n=1 Tax=Parasulfitobacter algicola TaxID=2614809 RepID=A0ABX2IS87_9RHOB|nr:outer membrane protein assembly factor BamE [Sulfitobacter algicola]NSX55175.1 outer membrane protein assembly factor BamE [Sulfitobacter algicola]
MQAFIKLFISLALVASLSACVATYRNHGYAPSDDELDDIIVGLDTRDSVIESVGMPSAEGVLNDSGVFYLQSRWRHYAYQAPRAVDRQLVVVRFDQDDVVSNVERFTLQDGQVVPLSRRVTDSNIEGITFLRQLLGNFGNFNPGDFFGGSDTPEP